jgi:hypothetical protein
MKTTITKFIAICLIAGGFLTNCKKAEAGPKGDTGPAGPTGTVGPAGNANVKSNTFTNITWTFNSTTKNFEAIISYSAITQEIVNTGAVMMYMETSSNYYSQLPTSFMFDASTILFFEFEHYNGGVKVYVHNSNLDNSIAPQSTIKFKIVAVAGSAKAQNPNVDYGNYTKVKEAYQLKD